MPKGVYPRKNQEHEIQFEERNVVMEDAVADMLVSQNEKLKSQIAALKAPKGIPTANFVAAQVQGETLKRSEEVMVETLPQAIVKEPEAMTEQDKVAIEREIRRYVKRGGFIKNSMGQIQPIPNGFVKGLSKEKIEYATELLKKMGRTEPKWDTSIVVPGFRNV